MLTYTLFQVSFPLMDPIYTGNRAETEKVRYFKTLTFGKTMCCQETWPRLAQYHTHTICPNGRRGGNCAHETQTASSNLTNTTRHFMVSAHSCAIAW